MRSLFTSAVALSLVGMTLACGGSDSSATLTIDRPAVLKNTTITSEPAGLSCGAGDDVCGGEFAVGTHVTLTITGFVSGPGCGTYGCGTATVNCADIAMDTDVVVPLMCYGSGPGP